MEYTIKVKRYMTKKGMEFNKRWNNDLEMPLLEMTGKVTNETKGMYFMELHGEGKETVTCMMCGRRLENDISRHYGLGPICGGHFYELQGGETVEDIKSKIRKIKWTGWIPKSAIKTITDGNGNKVDYMKNENAIPTDETVSIKTGKSTNLDCENSIYISMSYIKELISLFHSFNPIDRKYNPKTKVWEVNYLLREKVKQCLIDNNIPFEVTKGRQTDSIDKNVKY